MRSPPDMVLTEGNKGAVPLVPATARNIVAFIGQNENGILREASKSLMAFAPRGYVGHVVDLHAEGWLDRFRLLIDEGIAVAWGAAGIGAGLAIEGRSLWDTLRVPFVSVMSDSPCWLPANHRVEARFVANGYLFQDWLDIQRDLVRSPQVSSLLPLAALPNPDRDAVPWSRRGNRILFVKTGADPEAQRLSWKEFPPRFRDVVEDACAAALAAPVGNVSRFLLDAVRGRGLCLDGRPDVLFGLMKQVDVYVRDSRSTTLARALVQFPAAIVGRGWEHVSASPGRARFSPAVDASALPGIYADTRFLLNTMPNFSHRTHERVLSGFAARCCVVTNENADMAARFSLLPSYASLDLRHRDLGDRLASAFNSIELSEGATQPAVDLVESQFPAEAFVGGLLALAAEIRGAESPYFLDHAFRLPP